MKLNIFFDNRPLIYRLSFKTGLTEYNDALLEDVVEYKVIDNKTIDNSKANLSSFGKKIRDYRQSKGKSISEVAHAIGIDRTYLSKLENGHEPPTLVILNKLINYYSILDQEAQILATMAGFAGGGLVVLSHQERR